MSLPLPQFVTLQEGATAYRCDVKTLRRRIADGSLPAIRIGTRRPGTLKDTRPIRVRVSDLEAIMNPVVTAGGAR